MPVALPFRLITPKTMLPSFDILPVYNVWKGKKQVELSQHKEVVGERIHRRHFQCGVLITTVSLTLKLAVHLHTLCISYIVEVCHLYIILPIFTNHYQFICQLFPIMPIMFLLYWHEKLIHFKLPIVHVNCHQR